MDMSGSGFEGLPPWLQTIIAVGFFVGSVTLGLIGYTKKNWSEKLDEQKSQDAVVISASFADSRVIEQLGSSIKDLRGAVDDLEGAVQQFAALTRDSAEATSRLANSVNYATEAIRQSTVEMVRGQGPGSHR